MRAVKLIVGLGNPGERYESTRHNAGAWFVSHLAEAAQVTFSPESKFFGDCARVQQNNEDYRLLQPTTFMNDSGRSVLAMMQFYKLQAEEVLIVHDELDLPPGVARLKRGGGHGGHNGLRSIISAIGTAGFMRLRIGIGHPGDKSQVLNYVLKNPSREDREHILDSIYNAMHVMDKILNGQLEQAMNTLHTA